MVRFSGFVATRDFSTAQKLRQIQTEGGFGRISEQGDATFFTFDKGNNIDVKEALDAKNASERNYEYSPFKLSTSDRDSFAAGDSITRSQR